MSQFPALKPSSRSFTAGVLPVSAFSSVSGKETRVIMGNKRHGHTVELEYINVQETPVKKILQHWNNRQGTALSFTLPSAVWTGWAQYTTGVPSNQQWRYAAEPKVDAVAPSIMNVSIELVSLA